MNPYKIEIGTIRLSDYQTLRKSTGWVQFEDEIVQIALESDLFAVCIYDNEKAVGIGRIIGDGAIYFYIQDVIVLPDYQGKGLGKLIMGEIEKHLLAKADHNSFIGLMAAEGVTSFYQQFGYEKRPDDRPGMYKRINKK